MSWAVIVDGYARKYLKRIPRKDADRLGEILRELAYNPYAGDIEKIEGEIFGPYKSARAFLRALKKTR